MAGYRLTYEGVTILVDPYVSRVPLRSLLLRRPALPDPALLDRYIARAGGRGPRRPHALGPRGRRAGDRAPRRLPGLRLGLARAADAAARAGERRGRAAAGVRDRPVRRALRPEPALEAAVRPQGPVRRAADLRGPARALARRLQCGDVFGIRIEVAGTSLYHQGSADLDDAQRDRAGRRLPRRRHRPPGHAALLARGSCRGWTRAWSSRRTTTTSSRRSDRPLTLVRRVAIVRGCRRRSRAVSSALRSRARRADELPRGLGPRPGAGTRSPPRAGGRARRAGS